MANAETISESTAAAAKEGLLTGSMTKEEEERLRLEQIGKLKDQEMESLDQMKEIKKANERQAELARQMAELDAKRDQLLKEAAEAERVV